MVNRNVFFVFYVHPYWLYFELAFGSILSLWAYWVKCTNGLFWLLSLEIIVKLCFASVVNVWTNSPCSHTLSVMCYLYIVIQWTFLKRSRNFLHDCWTFWYPNDGLVYLESFSNHSKQIYKKVIKNIYLWHL